MRRWLGLAAVALGWTLEIFAAPGRAPDGKMIVIRRAPLLALPSPDAQVLATLEEGEVLQAMPGRIVTPAQGSGPTSRWVALVAPPKAKVWISVGLVDLATGRTKTDAGLLRAGPGVQYATVGRLPKGAEIDVSTRVDSWIRIDAPPACVVGFVDARWMRPPPDAVAILSASHAASGAPLSSPLPPSPAVPSTSAARSAQGSAPVVAAPVVAAPVVAAPVVAAPVVAAPASIPVEPPASASLPVPIQSPQASPGVAPVPIDNQRNIERSDVTPDSAILALPARVDRGGVGRPKPVGSASGRKSQRAPRTWAQPPRTVVDRFRPARDSTGAGPGPAPSRNGEHGEGKVDLAGHAAGAFPARSDRPTATVSDQEPALRRVVREGVVTRTFVPWLPSRYHLASVQQGEGSLGDLVDGNDSVRVREWRGRRVMVEAVERVAPGTGNRIILRVDRIRELR